MQNCSVEMMQKTIGFHFVLRYLNTMQNGSVGIAQKKLLVSIVFLMYLGTIQNGSVERVRGIIGCHLFLGPKAKSWILRICTFFCVLDSFRIDFNKIRLVSLYKM